jgi:ATP-binding cassette subfamily C (CFTR/MRP) protein 4
LSQRISFNLHKKKKVNANSFVEFLKQLNYLWASLLEIILSNFILWVYLGNAALVGMLALVILLPLNSYFAHQYSVAQLKKLRISDSKIKIINKVLNGIKV